MSKIAALAGIIFWLTLMLSVLLAAPAFAMALAARGAGLFLNLVFAAIALLLAWQMDQVVVPHLWIASLGLLLVATAFWLFRIGNRFVERDVASSDYYLSPHPVSEKLTNIAPGCLLTCQALACLVLGCGVLVAQAIVTFF